MRRALHPLDRLSFALYSRFAPRRAQASELRIGPADRRILVLAPHQDDELLGCGGSLMGIGGGRTIQVAYVTDGKGRAPRSREEQSALVETRRREARAVCAALGLSEPVFLNLDDGALTGDERLPLALEELVRSFEPQLIFAPFPTDAHPDHVATSIALARLPEDLLRGARLVLYQVHSHIPDRWMNRFFELSQPVQRAKEDALRLYVSQDMRTPLTLAKYLLFSKASPQVRRRRGIAAIEHFAEVGCAEFKRMCAQVAVLERSHRPDSTNYSPYSFRLYLRNRARFTALFGAAPPG